MDANKFKRMMKQIEDSLAAVSFAEEGEPESAVIMFRPERRVLLAVRDGMLDPKAFRYTLNTALRIGALIDILAVAPRGSAQKELPPALAEFEAELTKAAVPHRVIRKSGCLKQEIVDYTEKEHGVLFVVVDTPHSLDAECEKKDSALAELWKKLRCPLVVVAEGAEA